MPRRPVFWIVVLLASLTFCVVGWLRDFIHAGTPLGQFWSFVGGYLAASIVQLIEATWRRTKTARQP